MRNASIFLVCACLFGCAPPPPPHVTVSGDKFSSDYTVAGLRAFRNPFGGISGEWFLRSFVDKKTGTVTDQLYVDLSYIGAWKFFDRAADDHATPLDVVVIGRDVGDCAGGCSLEETIGVTLDDQTLRSRAATGYEVKIYADSGDALVLPITPQMIGEQMAAIDKLPTPHGR